MVHQYQRYRLLSQKSITRDKGGHDIFTKVSIHQVYITIISTYVLSNRTYKMHELKTDINKGIDGQLNSSWRNFNTPL